MTFYLAIWQTGSFLVCLVPVHDHRMKSVSFFGNSRGDFYGGSLCSLEVCRVLCTESGRCDLEW